MKSRTEYLTMRVASRRGFVNLTPEVELLGYEAIKRVCYTCFDGEE